MKDSAEVYYNWSERTMTSLLPLYWWKGIWIICYIQLDATWDSTFWGSLLNYCIWHWSLNFTHQQSSFFCCVIGLDKTRCWSGVWRNSRVSYSVVVATRILSSNPPKKTWV